MRSSWRILGLFVSLVLYANVAAEENSAVRPPSDDQRPLSEQVQELQARLAAYEAQYEAQIEARQIQPVGHFTDCKCEQPSCCAPSDWIHPCPGFYIDAELLLFHWTDTDGDDNQEVLQSGSRYTIGYENAAGRTFRARYFEFTSPDSTGPGSLQTEYLDLEYAARFALGRNWHGELSLGGRWATLQNPNPRNYADTLGPVVGLSVHSHLREWLSLYGEARYSMQFGDELTENHPSTFGITELALGAELSKKSGAVDWFLRSGVESQQYSSVRDDEEDYGLVGLTFRVGLRR